MTSKHYIYKLMFKYRHEPFSYAAQTSGACECCSSLMRWWHRVLRARDSVILEGVARTFCPQSKWATKGNATLRKFVVTKVTRQAALVGEVGRRPAGLAGACPADDGPLRRSQAQRRHRRVQQHVAADVRIHVLSSYL